MSYALAYLGTLAFVAFVLWLRDHDNQEAKQYAAELIFSVEEHMRREFASRPPDEKTEARLKALESTVSTLAVGAGLKMRSPVEPKA